MRRAYIKENNGFGIPTVKPWSLETYLEKLDLALNSNGLCGSYGRGCSWTSFLKGLSASCRKNEYRTVKEYHCKYTCTIYCEGCYDVKGALKAKEAGASAIVVSNHGGCV